jgi:hypothetical protein
MHVRVHVLPVVLAAGRKHAWRAATTMRTTHATNMASKSHGHRIIKFIALAG